MIEIFFTSMVIACLSAFAVTLMHKWGFIEHMQINADRFPEFVNQLFNCYFCLSWWVCVFISVLLFIFIGDFYVAVCPFVATPVAKFLLK